LPRAEQFLFARTVARLENDLDRILMMYTATIADTQPLAEDWTPRRLERWPLNFDQLEKTLTDGAQRLQALHTTVEDFDDKAIEAFNYVNGRYRVAQIARLVTGELGPFPFPTALALFNLLAEGGVVGRVIP
jgi:hypothetical protein